jgi:hypothetical protein
MSSFSTLYPGDMVGDVVVRDDAVGLPVRADPDGDPGR